MRPSPRITAASSSGPNAAKVALRPGVITPPQPKVPEAKIRGSQTGFQCVTLDLERVPGVPKGVQRGPMGYQPGVEAIVGAGPVQPAWGSVAPTPQSRGTVLGFALRGS